MSRTDKNMGSGFKKRVKGQVIFLQQFLKHFFIKVTEIYNADLAAKILYIGHDLIGPRFTQGKFILFYIQCQEKIHKGIDSESVVLGGNGAKLLGRLFAQIALFQKFSLLDNLARVSKKFRTVDGQ